ncbi:glycosyltransferase family 4 protein [Candidatus Woesearchaeota archaeon]|nr:glycosyltransferase family 4 protein [Candidatus Woesearchaeota archaeon]
MVRDKMKILIFAPYFWPHRGGVEKYAEETGVRLVKHGWKVDVVTALLRGMKEKESYRGMHVFRVPTWNALGGTYPVVLPGVFKFLQTLGTYDAVITHTRFFTLSFVGARFARKNKIPHLHIEHGTMHTGSKPFVYAVNWLYDHTIGYFVVHRARAVAGVSDASAKFARHLCKRKTIVLHNAIDSSFFKPVKTTKPYRQKVISFVGRLIEAKGVQDLVEATAEMENVKVLIIGSGNYARELRSAAGRNVVFLGEQDSAGIRKVLSYSDVFVNPSYAEGLPTSVLEAGAVGVPVIATDVGGTREIIDDKTGFLIKPKDVLALRERINWVLKNPVKAKRMAKLLQQKVRKEFDWTVTSKALDKVLKSLR